MSCPALLPAFLNSVLKDPCRLPTPHQLTARQHSLLSALSWRGFSWNKIIPAPTTSHAFGALMAGSIRQPGLVSTRIGNQSETPYPISSAGAARLEFKARPPALSARVRPNTGSACLEFTARPPALFQRGCPPPVSSGACELHTIPARLHFLLRTPRAQLASYRLSLPISSNAFLRRSYVFSRCSEITLVSASTGMKLVSPFHLGTR